MRRPAAPDPAADRGYAALKARIVVRTGHHYYTDKDDLLLDRLRRRYRACGVADAAAYAALLDDGPEGEAEWAALEAEITIGETFFFRYAEQFAALRTTILPDLIAARARTRTLRVWSAGCSTGAEPYSIAILLHDLLGPALGEWRIQILGTDISTAALSVARAGIYGRWALRTTEAAERERLFRSLPAEPGSARDGRYHLRPEFQRMVRFERGNLLTLIDAGVPRERFDLILCRNVLIYFDASTVAGIMRGLARAMGPGGWLLIGHAEPNPAFASWLKPVSLPGTVAYRPADDLEPAPPVEASPAPPAETVAKPAAESAAKPAAESAAEPAAKTSAEAPAAAVEAPAAAPEAPAAEAPPAPASPTAQPPASPPAPPADPGGAGPAEDAPAEPDVRDAVRALADAGESGAAWRLIGEALAQRPTDPVLRYYEGLVARTLGRDAEAERALRAALYLDRGFVMAHYHLGLLLGGLGRTGEARRALDNAVRLGQALPADAALPEADDATAREIAAIAAAARDGLARDGSARDGTGRDGSGRGVE